jgi:hypothetical protein
VILNLEAKVKKFITVCLVLLVPLLVGCNKSAPKCGDEQTKTLVFEIAWEEFANQLGLPMGSSDFKKYQNSIVFSLESVRTTDFNKSTGKQSCAADLIMTGPDGASKIPITYTSENMDDGKSFYVEVSGL